MMQYARSLVFIVFMYALMLAMGVALAPMAAWSRQGAWWALHRYTDIVLWAARRLCGLRVEVRGRVPTEDVIVASKHQSFMDILILTNVLPRPRFVMKRSLRWTPILGFYAMRVGCAPVDREAGARAVRDMVARMRAAAADSGQTVIFPQGTRLAPGAKAPYKPGVAALAMALRQPVVPASTNCGMFWPRRGLLRRAGVATLEFHDPLPAGLPKRELLARLEEVIEAGSARLEAEARAQLEGR
ncbi:lysophospholipid acyltransferase family protein [Oceanicella actignis]|uniref:1-acyl-sn-glycerol-3-phosphate acyltransferase n=1 Tax=Oceanicella actignis TaxID=1189325 RepID=A0A1M7SE12_9RHOB|nr:lysophospholipid acyltransferase family protein [Oceanicella actignis]SET23916.1 1-acyl-sn-glycerol-3-phosphate acyltransferase [Oceanicella actignis]SHN56730.1 1-acyl-sn-glycerol-3-phosphate acyltransferase [Oceanicella actignis]